MCDIEERNARKIERKFWRGIVAVKREESRESNGITARLIKPYHTAVQYSAVQCTPVHHTTTHYSIQQYNTSHYSAVMSIAD